MIWFLAVIAAILISITSFLAGIRAAERQAKIQYGIYCTTLDHWTYAPNMSLEDAKEKCDILNDRSATTSSNIRFEVKSKRFYNSN